ncbi:MAG: nucleoside phosphorylase [Flavobacteriales bacterium]
MAEQESELVLSSNGSVYHLHLREEHVADNVILVGDPGRVETVSSFFDDIEYRISNREFTTHTGTYKGLRVTALSTGIGTDNIDIVVNELDAAVNMDLQTRQPKDQLRKLNLIRLGTCGALQEDLRVESTVVTEFSIGLDGIRHFYKIEPDFREKRLETDFLEFMDMDEQMNNPYATVVDPDLLSKFQSLGNCGITIAANGFFGPQGRTIRLPLANPRINELLSRFQYGNLRVLNYEMESSALYSLGKALGHRCLCMCVVVANRSAGKFSKDYHPAVHDLIESCLNKLAT